MDITGIQHAAAMIGKTATLTLDRRSTLKVRVLVKNTKHDYGRYRFEVTPCSGEGSQWVDQDSLQDIF